MNNGNTPTARVKAVLFWIAMAVLPPVFLCIFALLRGVYPFGPEAFLGEDQYYQFVDFFTWFRNTILEGGNLTYTASLSLGMNAWGLFSYYLASPFNFIVLLFDEAHVFLAFFVIAAAKLSAIQLSTTLFVHRRFDLPLLASGALGLCFTLGEWVMVNLRNPMWLDVCYLLPLAMLATWSFLRDGRIVKVVLPVAASIMFCWYMGYIACLFLGIYAIFEAWCLHVEQPGLGWRHYAARVASYAIAMLLALALSAWIFLPTVLTFMEFSATSSATSYDPKTISAPKLALASLFSGTSFHWRRSPQIFIGSVPLVLSFYYLLRMTGNARLRGGYAVFLAFLAAGTCVSTLYYIWCGMREPNGFFSRMSFLISFAILWGAAAAWRDMREHEVKLRPLAFACAILLAVFAYCAYSKRFLSLTTAVVAAACIIAAAALIVLLSKSRESQKASHAAPSPKTWSVAACAVVFAFCAVEMPWAAFHSWSQLYIDRSQEYQEGYIERATAQIEELKALDSGLYRVDKTYTRAKGAALNEGMARGYMQLSSYTSSQNANALAFLDAIGYSDPGQINLTYKHPIPLADSLFGIKYAFVKVPEVSPSTLYENVKLKSLPKGVRLLRNPYALSFGYLVSEQVTNLSYDPFGGQPFDVQNDMVSAMLGRSVELYKPLAVKETKSTPAKRTWQISVAKDQLGYVYFFGGSNGSSGITYTIDKNKPIRENWRFHHTILELEPGKHTITIEPGDEQGEVDDVECTFTYIETTEVKAVLSELAQHQMEFQAFEDGRFTGGINAPEDAYVLLTIPYEDGWSFEVNGVATQPQRALGGSCMAVPIKAGHNIVRAQFTLPGLHIGIAISALAAMVCIVLGWRSIRARKMPGTHVPDLPRDRQ